MGILCSLRLGSKKKGFLGFRFADPEPAVYTEASLETPEAQAYVAAATPDIAAEAPTVGYASQVMEEREETEAIVEMSEELTELENQAHSQRILLSSDAMRYFIAKVVSIEERSSALDRVMAKARVSFPSEDGWVVLNLARMEQLIEEVNAEQDELIADDEISLKEAVAPTTAGSLAEAIITGNIVAAYEMISSRPMIALADAASDLDALFRMRKGEAVTISDMLKEQSVRLTNEQLTAAIAALTSALDGTYTDEASAVKMAIMKAVKAIA